MEKILLYIKESYNELMHHVTWPTWGNLQASTIVVVISTIILTLFIFLMDVISKQSLGLIYNL